MAASRMTADVALAVQGFQTIVGTIDVPFTAETGEAVNGHVSVELRLDKAGLRLNIASLLRAVADEFERGESHSTE